MQFQIGKVFSSFFHTTDLSESFLFLLPFTRIEKRFQVELGEIHRAEVFLFSCACLHCNLTILRNSFYFLYRSETDTSFSFQLGVVHKRRRNFFGRFWSQKYWKQDGRYSKKSKVKKFVKKFGEKIRKKIRRKKLVKKIVKKLVKKIVKTLSKNSSKFVKPQGTNTSKTNATNSMVCRSNGLTGKMEINLGS